MNRVEDEGIIEDADTMTGLVEAAMRNTPDPRLRQILLALVRHSHAFLREVRLTDQEFEQGHAFLRAVGESCTDLHNEVVLLADVLGISTLVTLLNGCGGERTSGALLGPFFRDGAPRFENGANIAASGSPGLPLVVRVKVVNTRREPIAGATVDVWQASPVGLYENQDPEQPEMNLRGQFRTNDNGEFYFHSVCPAGYPVPTHGPVGALLAAQKRHPYRPAHIHFLVVAPGYATLVTQVFADDSDHLGSDVVFGVTRDLVGRYELREGTASSACDGPHYSLEYEFVLAEGESFRPVPPIK
ncbi:catechol 1,2-dioxygenase [Paraburkholderia steynii]|uniref:Catechol 1,2-dioxygenase n=1 Tax=Paraburkholderia steynii TaxID=1245441 RepID=A0A7Z7BAZ9_9BURK|nr:dioxygenase [Paraburkholderia steynii]SDI50402.1 catechol 1,2-dioxygenase [Paraburkholderia steynii]